MRLSAATLASAPAAVARPAYDWRGLGCGVAHMGPGAFHRAHQGLYTDAAIAAAGGPWGIAAIALHHDRARVELEPQDGLYTVEVLDEQTAYRISGSLRRVVTAPRDPADALAALSDPDIHVVTLTVTENGYQQDASGAFDLDHPDVVHDLALPAAPRTATAWLARGLAIRAAAGIAPPTIISCDNLVRNGRRLREAVLEFSARAHAEALGYIEREVAFPSSVVDCITPASDGAHRARVQGALGLADAASVQREPYAQWVIEHAFAGPRPAWERVGVDLTDNVESYERLKLHVLNAVHSTLAVLGLPRGLLNVREAMADSEISRLVEALVEEEIAAALADLDVAGYWRATRPRLANRHIDHSLMQIAQNSAAKLKQRVFPMLIDNARSARPAQRLGKVVRAWIEGRGVPVAAALDDEGLFPPPFRDDAAVRRLVLGA